MIPIEELKIGDIVWSMGATFSFPSFVSDIRIDKPGGGVVWLSQDKIKTPGLTCSNGVLFRTFGELMLGCWKPKALLPGSDTELFEAVARAYNAGTGSLTVGKSEPAKPDRDFEMLLGMLCHPRNAKYFQGDPDILRLAHGAMRRFRKNHPDHPYFFDEYDPQIQPKSVEEMQKNEPPPDPVHCDDGKWYFWDETWADRQGPYDTEDEARNKMQDYVEKVLGHGPTAMPKTELEGLINSEPSETSRLMFDMDKRKPTTFAEAMASVTKVTKKLSDSLGRVTKIDESEPDQIHGAFMHSDGTLHAIPEVYMPDETADLPGDLDEFIEMMQSEGLQDRDCSDKETCPKCNVVGANDLPSDLMKKWSAGTCVCKQLPSLSVGWRLSRKTYNAIVNTRWDTISREEIESRKATEGIEISDEVIADMRKAAEGDSCFTITPIVKLEITDEMRKNVRKGVLKTWGQNEQDSCNCGGPPGHVPNGSNCRKPL